MNFNTLLFLGGVIGSKMPRFCLFGETINLASRMESHGEPGRIQISTNTKTLLELTEAEGYRIEPRGSISIKVYIFSIKVFNFVSLCYKTLILCFLMYILKNFHGLHTLNEAFLHRNPELLGLGRKIGRINSGAFGGI